MLFLDHRKEEKSRRKVKKMQSEKKAFEGLLQACG